MAKPAQAVLEGRLPVSVVGEMESTGEVRQACPKQRLRMRAVGSSHRATLPKSEWGASEGCFSVGRVSAEPSGDCGPSESAVYSVGRLRRHRGMEHMDPRQLEVASRDLPESQALAEAYLRRC
jgi:hypothetical protein